MKPKFEIMDKVKIIKDGTDNNVREDGGGLKMIAVVVEYLSTNRKGYDTFTYKLRSEEFKKRPYWWFEEEYLELLDDEPKAQMSSDKWNTKCSRCGAPAYQGLLFIECSKCKEDK